MKKNGLVLGCGAVLLALFFGCASVNPGGVSQARAEKADPSSIVNGISLNQQCQILVVPPSTLRQYDDRNTAW
jgi:hypothetical protein